MWGNERRLPLIGLWLRTAVLAENWQAADRVMTAQSGVPLPRDGAFDASVTLPVVGEITSPSGLFRERPNKMR